MSNELLPCPFCGGTARAIVNNIEFLSGHIECIDCLIEVSYDGCIKSAAEIWNKRINPSFKLISYLENKDNKNGT